MRFGVDAVRNMVYKNKTMLFFGTALLVSLAVMYAVLTRVNFLGDMVLRQIEKAVGEQFSSEVSFASLTGNPLTGFEGKHLVISRKDKELISADSVFIDISLPSLITGSPRVGRLEVEGFRSDYGSLMSMLPKNSADSGPKDIPINKIAVNGSRIDTPWGALELDGSTIRPTNTEKFGLDLRGALASVPAAFSGEVVKSGGNWTFDRTKLKLAEGSALAKGSVYPAFDLTLDLKDIDLAKVKKFIPSLGKSMLSGSVSGNINITGSMKDIAVRGAGTLKKAHLAGIPMEEVHAEWDYSKNLIEVKLNKGSFFKSTVTGNFSLDSSGSVPYLVLDAKVNNLNFNDWKDRIKEQVGYSEALKISGGISQLDANISGPLDALKGYVNLAPSSVGYKTMKITNLKGQAVFSGKPSGNVDFSALYKSNTVKLTGTLGLAKDAASDLRLDAGSLALDEISSLIDGMKNYRLRGDVSVSAALTGVLGELVASGSVVSRQITEDKYGAFTNIGLRPKYSFKNGLLSFEPSSAEWNGALITADGSIQTGEAQTLNLRGTMADGDTANFETILPVLKTLAVDAVLSGEWSVGGTVAAPTAEAKISSQRGSARGLAFDHLSAKLGYTSGKLTFSDVNMKIGSGAAKLAAEVFFPRDASGAYLPVIWSADGDLADIPGAAVNGPLNLDQPFSGNISGRFKAANAPDGLRWSFQANGKNLAWREFKADSVKGNIFGDSSEINIDNLLVSFLRGENLINGKITLPGDGQPATEGTLDLTVEIRKINLYELLRKHIPAVRGFQGLVTGGANIGGTIGDPVFSGEGTVAPLRFRSFLLPMVDLKFSGDMRGIRSESKARLHAGTLKANASLLLEGGEWNASAEVDGKEINLRQLGRYLPEGFREKLDGNADFTLAGGGRLGSFSGSGTFRSQQMRIWGVDVNDLNAPFYISEGYAIMEDVKAKSSGGDLTGGVAVDMTNNRWGGNLTVMSADVAIFMDQSVPQLKGRITGKGDFKIRMGGEMGRMSTVRAAGVLMLKDGTLSEFAAVEAAQKFTRGNPLRFDTVQISFNYDGGFLTILPGSQAIAPKNDPVYRYAMVDGTIDENGVLTLFAMGKANIQALNALLGAIQGLMDMDIDLNESLDKADLLQGLIGGALSGFSRSDFRFVTMGIRGPYDAPRFDNIKVQSGKMAASEAIPKTSSDPKEDAFDSENKTFRFRFEIPVGPGSSGSGNGLNDQARGQILKNALDSLLRNSDF